MLNAGYKLAFSDLLTFWRGALTLTFAMFAGSATVRGGPSYTIEGRPDAMLAIVLGVGLIATQLLFGAGDAAVHRTTLAVFRNQALADEGGAARRHVATDIVSMVGHLLAFAALALLCWKDYGSYWWAMNALIGVNFIWLTTKQWHFFHALSTSNVTMSPELAADVRSCMRAIKNWMILNSLFLMAFPILSLGLSHQERWLYLIPAVVIVVRAVLDFYLCREFYTDVIVGHFKRNGPAEADAE